MDRKKFYAALRRRNSGVFGTSLSQTQVDGTNALLEECARVGADIGQAAYILATVYGETGGRMQPVRENMNYRASQIRKHFGAHRRQGLTPERLARNPKLLANTVYGGEWGQRNLGNIPGTDDGWNFRGALQSQMTGRRNTVEFGNRLGVDFIANPELLDDPVIGARSVAQPMMEGWATKYKLSEFVSGDKRDYLGARKVWGGVDAQKYVDHAKAFEAALTEGGWAKQPAPAKTPTQAPKADPAPDPKEQAPSGLARLIQALIALLKGLQR